MAYYPQFQNFAQAGQQQFQNYAQAGQQQFQNYSQSGQQVMQESMTQLCQTATAALQEQQRLAAEMRVTLAKVKAMFPDSQAPVPCEVDVEHAPSPDGEDWTVITPTTPEVQGQVQMEHVLELEDDFVDPDAEEDALDESLGPEASAAFDKTLYGVTHENCAVNYDEPVFTLGACGRQMFGRFNDCEKSITEFSIGDIVRYEIKGKKKQYGVVTKKNKMSVVVDDIMFIPEKKRELALPIHGKCGYKIGRAEGGPRRTNLSMKRSLAKLV